MRISRVAALARRVTPAGAGLLGVTVLLLIISVVATVAANDLGRARVGDSTGWSSTLLGLVMLSCGVVIGSFSPRHRVGVVLQVFGGLWAVDGTLEAYLVYASSFDPPLPGVSFSYWFVGRVGAFLLLGLPLVMLLYPDGRLLPGIGRAVSVASIVAATLLPAALLVAPASVVYLGLDLPPGAGRDPFTLPMSEPTAIALLTITRTITFAALLPPLALVVLRYRRADAGRRRQLRWLLWAGLICLLTIVTSLLLPSSDLASALLFVAVATTSVSVTIGIINPDLADIDALVSATVVYAAVAALVIVLDLALLAGTAALLGDRLSEREVTIAALVVAVAIYGPLRHWLWRVARRLVVGRRGDRYAVVSSLAARLEATDAVGDQLPALAESVAQSFKLAYTGVEVIRPGGDTVVAAYGIEPAETQTLPIAYRGERIGQLVLPARGLRSMLSYADQLLLLDVVRQAAVAIRNATLANQLQESRERLVLDREEDRRRIRRDLHDGLGPALGGVALRLDAAGNALSSRPEQAAELVRQARAEVTEALSDVRRLVHGLRPPALDDLGLVAAVEQQAERVRSAELAVEVSAAGLPPLPAAVEVAAYRIVAEALTNVVRHAGARRCWVQLAAEGTELRIEVGDDGRGIGTDVAAGVGLLSVRERTGELGGHSSVSCPSTGGTVLQAWLPISTGGR